MAIRDTIRAALMGVSAFQDERRALGRLSLDDDIVERTRAAHGGQLQPRPVSVPRWYPKDIERAERAADNGDMSTCALLMRAAHKDGYYSGVMSTRTAGLVQLPKKFRGNDKIIEKLEAKPDEARSIFDEMFPSAELALLAQDGVELGVGVAELVDVGRGYPIMIRLDPAFLLFLWEENQWYYRSIAGNIRITPGDGRWILHLPGGRNAPWQHGLWRAIARSFIRKEHASFYRDNWLAKLANSARVATSPQGGTDAQKDTWFRQVMAWGVNTVFSVTPGYDVKLLESNGRGYEAFKETIADANTEFTIAVAGQTVTTDGGAGFQNSDIHKSIRADLIKATADSLTHTINTQGLPTYVVDHFGEDALEDSVTVEYDVTPPKDRNAVAMAMVSGANAIKTATAALAEHDLTLAAKEIASTFGIPLGAKEDAATKVDAATLKEALELAAGLKLQPTKDSVVELCERLGVKLEDAPAGTQQPQAIAFAPTDIVKFVTVKEGRASVKLDELGDERDDLMIAEMGEKATADAEAEADIKVDDNAAANAADNESSEVVE